MYRPPVPPPAGRTSAWVWVAIAMSAVALLMTVVLPLIVLGFFAASIGGFDGDFDEDDYLDQGSVLEAIERPCEDMLAAAENVTLGGPSDKTAASLRRWTAVAQGIVTAVDRAKPDQDSREWRDDWKATIKAVNAYADNFGKPNNTLTLPDSLEDMYWETDAECGVPVVIAGLDPEWAGYMLGE